MAAIIAGITVAAANVSTADHQRPSSGGLRKLNKDSVQTRKSSKSAKSAKSTKSAKSAKSTKSAESNVSNFILTKMHQLTVMEPISHNSPAIVEFKR